MFDWLRRLTNRVNNAISLLQKNKKLNVHAIVFGKHNYNSLKLQSKSKYKKIVCVENLFEKIEKNFEDKELKKYLNNFKNLKRKYKINLTKLIYSERIFVNHAHFNKYRIQLNHEEICFIVYSIFTYILKLVTKNKIRLIFVYTAASLISEILYEISKIKKLNLLHLIIQDF